MIAAIIPIKKNSERVPGKNFRLVNGIPLYRYLLDKLKNCNFDRVYVDSDSEEIKKYCEKNGYFFIQRKPELTKNDASGNDLLNYHAEIVKADLYFQLYITSPLLKIETINECIKILKQNQSHDSILTSKSIRTWFWYKNKPVNYDPRSLPRSQDATPLIYETSGLYGIRRNTLISNKSRIGNNPLFYEVSDEEAIDLDTERDFQYLEYYIKNFLNNNKSTK
tara:strand:- start:1008 stop:1673 length:666 start_codon:yes stop_codon:yes gene_type:complete